jgi:hypothetical protein
MLLEGIVKRAVTTGSRNLKIIQAAKAEPTVLKKQSLFIPLR